MAESPGNRELEEIFVKKDKLILVSSAQEEIADGAELLRNAPVITFPEGSIFRRRLELLTASLGITYGDRLVVLNSLGAQLVNIAAGLGAGYLPESIVRPYIEKGIMKENAPEETDRFSELDIMFIYRRDHITDAAFRYFLEMVKAERKTGQKYS